MGTKFFVYEGSKFIKRFDNISVEWTDFYSEAYDFGSYNDALIVSMVLNDRYGYEMVIMSYSEATKQGDGWFVC